MAVPVPEVPLPTQPAGVPWPTPEWPVGPPPARIAPLLEAAFGGDPALDATHAVVVVQGGRLVAERYGGRLEPWDGPPVEVDGTTPLLSWSMAKSVLHAAVGVLVGDARLAVHDVADVPAWRSDDDPRSAITLDHLLAMRDGLDFSEDYVDADRSDVIHMLFGAGKGDVAAFAADRPLAAAPGARFNYSSGTSNIVSGIVARAVGAGRPYEAFLAERVFGPLGMTTARPGLDTAGTWVASSYLHATARDYARFGLLYLRDGWWDGRRVLPEGWVDAGRLRRSVDEDGSGYGAHWWTIDDGRGTFAALGHDGQSITVCPALDAVVVRLGKTPTEHGPDLERWRGAALDALA